VFLKNHRFSDQNFSSDRYFPDGIFPRQRLNNAEGNIRLHLKPGPLPTSDIVTGAG